MATQVRKLPKEASSVTLRCIEASRFGVSGAILRVEGQLEKRRQELGFHLEGIGSGKRSGDARVHLFGIGGTVLSTVQPFAESIELSEGVPSYFIVVLGIGEKRVEVPMTLDS